MDVLKKIYKGIYSEIPERDAFALEYLKEKGINTSDVHKKIYEALRIPYLDLSNVNNINNINLMDNFSKDEMKSRRIFPLYTEGDKVYFVTNSLINSSLKSYSEEYTRKLGKQNSDIKYFVMNFEFDSILEYLYEGNEISDYEEQLKEIEKLNGNSNAEIVEYNENVKKESLAKFDVEQIAELILNKGFENRSSDIHIEPLDEGFQVRYRTDGDLSIVDPYDVSELQTQSLINHFKLKGDLRIEERRKGQDGSISDRKYKGNSYDIRISSIATKIGNRASEKIAMRVLEKSIHIPNFKDLGFSKFYISAIKKDINKHHGLILNTGSVGSGKSTTQRTVLVDSDAKKLNIYSIEDPVEMTIPYVNHICVKETSVSFESHLETLLRQDPDIVAIGEIRNLATMDMALKAALSGQLVFATMHTNSAIEAFYRLFNMGVESYELGAALLGIGSQRLVKTLCPYCSVKNETADHERLLISGMLNRYPKFSDINLSKFDYLHSAKGCNHCNHTGYHGRTVIAEYLTASDSIRNYISNGEVDRDHLLELAESSFVPIEVDALNKVLLGKTTLAEIIKAV